MRYHLMNSNDIRLNLATEEYLMNEADVSEPLFLLYIQEPCVILGRNQNAYEEVNLAYLRRNQMILTRRISGGGAVYDDLGNLSFSFVTKKDAMVFGDYQGVTLPILEALHRFGATEAVSGGRNDLYIQGKKISGNAMYSRNGRTYSHGTLMYDVNHSVLDDLLTVAKEKIESKATQSVKKNVTNIREYLDSDYQKWTTEEFRDGLLCQIFGVTDLSEIKGKELLLTAEDEQAIQELVTEKYGNDEWIYGENPPFNSHHRIRKPGVGIVDVKLSINKGTILSMNLSGDFFGSQPIDELVALLLDKPFIFETIKHILDPIKMEQYILNFSKEEFLALLFEEEGRDVSVRNNR